ncbi:hypothetical protein Cyan10605_3513 (plasmid) [Cyanobacterium aponinum PCC 10605]|uniref:Uncharacterized protein n=2 Tax=Cyanobacterium TaxID=102234 RepID=K9Z8M2_CYAAP|nr:hypothetical protein Cyan10605_3513 [Cyanobacterium aponinum PCC 10605]
MWALPTLQVNKNKIMAKKNKTHQKSNNPQSKLTPPPIRLNHSPNQPKTTTTLSTVNQSSNSTNNQFTQPNNSTQLLTQSTRTIMVQPEQMSLTAHQQIQIYLQSKNRPSLEEKDLTAILRLSTHLRVFGLLSAVGYINQSNDQQGEVRQRTIPVWRSLLGQLINPENPPQARELMETVQNMARNNSTEYMMMWRKSLILSQYWNFWGRAYTQND